MVEGNARPGQGRRGAAPFQGTRVACGSTCAMVQRRAARAVQRWAGARAIARSARAAVWLDQTFCGTRDTASWYRASSRAMPSLQ
jgi:hypothetical protein